MARSIKGTVRLGGHTFRPGNKEDVKALYQYISADDAERLVERGVLAGDWSGAKGQYNKEADALAQRRAARSPFGRALQRMGITGVEPAKPARGKQQEETTATEEGGEIEYARPFTLREKGGGWYEFRDANDEAYLDDDGEPLVVQGEEAANQRLEQLNAE